MVDPFQASIKAASLFGIFMMWSNFTFEVLRYSWYIISTSPKKKLTKPSQKSVVKNARDFSMVN